MNDYRFYADLVTRYDPPLHPKTTVRRLREMGDAGEHVNCIALKLNGALWMPLTREPNCQPEYRLRYPADLRNCRRIPEKIARKLHPRLFEKLDAMP